MEKQLNCRVAKFSLPGFPGGTFVGRSAVAGHPFIQRLRAVAVALMALRRWNFVLLVACFGARAAADADGAAPSWSSPSSLALAAMPHAALRSWLSAHPRPKVRALAPLCADTTLEGADLVDLMSHPDLRGDFLAAVGPAFPGGTALQLAALKRAVLDVVALPPPPGGGAIGLSGGPLGRVGAEADAGGGVGVELLRDPVAALPQREQHRRRLATSSWGKPWEETSENKFIRSLIGVPYHQFVGGYGDENRPSGEVEKSTNESFHVYNARIRAHLGLGSDNYDTNVAPNVGGSVNVSVSVLIYKAFEVDFKRGTLELSVSVRLAWYDERCARRASRVASSGALCLFDARRALSHARRRAATAVPLGGEASRRAFRLSRAAPTRAARRASSSSSSSS